MALGPTVAPVTPSRPSPDDFVARLNGDKVNFEDKLASGAFYEIKDGDLLVKEGASIREATEDERKEILAVLRSEYVDKGKPEVKGHLIVFRLNKAPGSGVVSQLISSAKKRVEKVTRNDEQEVRAWGMVSMARAHFESKTPEPSPAEVVDFLKTQFTADFKGNEDELELFAQEAVKLAKNKVKNTESATRVVARLKLAEEIADRLGKMGKEADIRVALSADSKVKTFKNKNGTEIHRAKAEVEEILEIAFAKAKVLFAAKAKEKAGSFNLRARDLEMVSLVRFLKDDGYLEDDIREKLKLEFDGEENLAQLIDAAWNGATNTEHNKNAAARMVDKRKFGADVAQRLARGEKEKDVRDTILAEVDEMTLPKSGKVKRSTEEKEEIWTAALAEAKKLQAKEKTNEGELIETAHKEGMVVRARRFIEEGGNVADAEADLIAEFPGPRAKALAEAAVKEAVNNAKYKLRLAAYVKAAKLGEKIVNERAAGKTKLAIETQLKVDEENYTNPAGKAIQRSVADLNELVAAAFRQADALAEAKRKASHSTTKRRAMVPGSVEGTWEKKMTDNGTFRLVRLRREEGKTEDEIRTEVEALFSGEHDPEAMAVYAMEQAADAAFNQKQAEQLVFMRSLDRIAKKHMEATPPLAGGALEAEVRTEIKAVMGANISNTEVEDLMHAAINKAESGKAWKERGERTEAWAKGPGWELAKKGAKYGAVGTAVLGLGTAALGLVASAAALTLGWKGIKLVGRGIGTAAAYGLPMMGEAARAGVNVAGATLKFARNTLLYTPASIVATPMVRTYQAAKVALNYPDAPAYTKPEIKKPANKEAKGWTSPFTWMANGFRSTTTGIGNLFRRTGTATANLFRGGWHKTKQAGLLAAALLTAPVVGLGEGAAIGVGHHIAGAEWHGSKTIDAFMEENGKPHAAPTAAPAANGKDHGHDKAHAKKDH